MTLNEYQLLYKVVWKEPHGTIGTQTRCCSWNITRSIAKNKLLLFPTTAQFIETIQHVCTLHYCSTWQVCFRYQRHANGIKPSNSVNQISNEKPGLSFNVGKVTHRSVEFRSFMITLHSYMWHMRATVNISVTETFHRHTRYSKLQSCTLFHCWNIQSTCCWWDKIYKCHGSIHVYFKSLVCKILIPCNLW